MSSGLGPSRWLRPVFGFAFPVAVIVALLSLLVTPWANRQSSEFRARFEQRTDVARVAPGQFRESADGQKVFFVEGLGQRSTAVRNVFVSSTQHGRVGVMVSQSGSLEHEPNGDDFLVMTQGRRYEGSPGQPDYKVMQFDHYGVRIESNPPDFSADNSMKIRATSELILLGSRKAMGELVWRLGLPISVLTLALLAIPLSAVNPRAGRSANLLIAIFVYFTYTNGLGLVQNYTSQGRMSFSLAWWSVHAIVLVIALLMTQWRLRVHSPWRAWLSLQRSSGGV